MLQTSEPPKILCDSIELTRGVALDFAGPGGIVYALGLILSDRRKNRLNLSWRALPSGQDRRPPNGSKPCERQPRAGTPYGKERRRSRGPCFGPDYRCNLGAIAEHD